MEFMFLLAITSPCICGDAGSFWICQSSMVFVLEQSFKMFQELTQSFEFPNTHVNIQFHLSLSLCKTKLGWGVQDEYKNLILNYVKWFLEEH
jgi:hypothetical protein